jgi:hypothetical protein
LTSAKKNENVQEVFKIIEQNLLESGKKESKGGKMRSVITPAKQTNKKCCE